MMLKLRNACCYVVTLASAVGPFTSAVRVRAAWVRAHHMRACASAINIK